MSLFLNYTPQEVKAFGEKFDAGLRNCSSIQEASQLFVTELYREFESSLALVRFYLTVPYDELPAKDQEFAKNIADANDVGDQLRKDTIILSLMGTYGSKEAWCDRYDSQGHLAIPLISSEFVGAIPMIAKLMNDMDIGLDWLDTRNTEIVVKKLGRLIRVFYVPEAATFVDEDNRLVVPAQDFVTEHGVRTVFGLGGGYLKGPFGALIFFTKEQIDKPRVEMFFPLMTQFKLATTRYVVRQDFYS